MFKFGRPYKLYDESFISGMTTDYLTGQTFVSGTTMDYLTRQTFVSGTTMNYIISIDPAAKINSKQIIRWEDEL
jgi:hypothetical protein